MKLTVELNGENHQISFQREDARLWALVDGRRYEATVREVEQDVYLLLMDGRVYECRVESNPKQRESFVVNSGNRLYEMTLVDPKRLRGGVGSSADVGDGSAQIIAPMPGKIVRVLVEQGAQVAAGDGIIVVEAMKMQNEMKSPRAGTVTEIRAAAGETVNAGDVLAVIE
jgi:biotin carboxyl carrier protein